MSVVWYLKLVKGMWAWSIERETFTCNRFVRIGWNMKSYSE
jgi:hypothetical protein